MPTATLTSRIENDDGNIRRWLNVETDSAVVPPPPIFFEFSKTRPPVSMDSMVHAIIFWAMAARVDLMVAGSMTRRGCANIDEYQSAIAAIFGDRYRPVRIAPRDIEDPPPPDRQAVISLFSGGVDSVFTLLRHQGGGLGVKALPIDSVLLVHHESLDRGDLYIDERLKRTRPLLDSMGVDVRTLRTNLRETLYLELLGKYRQRYVPSFAAQLAASLHQYEREYCDGLLGSTEPYHKLVMKVGSTPAVDWLLSTGRMRIVHDGAGFSRTEKIAQIAQNPIARKALHVCFDHPYLNCGKCSKCVRTYLNFLAAGIDRPECMPGALDLAQIDTVNIRSAMSINEFQSIIDSAVEMGNVGPWTYRLKDRLRYGGRGSARALVRRFRARIGRSYRKRFANRRTT